MVEHVFCSPYLLIGAHIAKFVIAQYPVASNLLICCRIPKVLYVALFSCTNNACTIITSVLPPTSIRPQY